jgi:small subunit ribosomal protein S1
MTTDKDTDATGDFGDLLEAFERQEGGAARLDLPQVGESARGRVVSIGSETVFVDIGGRAEATIEREELMQADGTLEVGVGDWVEAKVISVDSAAGSVVLGRSLGHGADGVAELEYALAHELPVDGIVHAVIKGGFEVQVAGVRAFCPISQMELRSVEQPEAYLKQRYQFRITRLEGGRQPNVVLSRRALLEQAARAQADALRQRLAPGLVLTGTVIALKPYGAFVDLGGLEGMVHISELGFDRIEHPEDVLRVGQSIEVQVLRIERTTDPKRPEKIALSMRSLMQDPWDTAAARLTVGSCVRGRVVRLEPFGAFVEVAPGVEGLVHVSEIPSQTRLAHARQALALDQEVEAQVLSIEPQRRRIALSIAAARQQAEAGLAEEARKHLDNPSGLGTLGDLLKNKLPQK